MALLVTTSFLNLRRYLRQRRIEMPLPIAGTWVGVGAVLIANVDGDVYGVMGLPLGPVVDLLARFGRPYRFTR